MKMPKQSAVVSIDKARRGRAASVRDGILEYLDELYRFALRMTRDAEHARDLIQESILRALERQNTEVHNPRAWLFQVVYHSFVSRYRRDLVEGALEANWPADETGGSVALNPLRGAVVIGDVRSAIENLPEELRAVVWLSDAEEFHLREIAEILGWPLGTVASRLARARQELRRSLSAYGPPREK